MVLESHVAQPRGPEALAKEILAYFVQNPQAVDSLEGIARWRLQEERIRRQVQDTSIALDWLVRQQYLERVSSPMTEPVYRLNEPNRSAVERFLARKTAAKRKGRK
jgi:hypothetical protein